METNRVQFDYVDKRYKSGDIFKIGLNHYILSVSEGELEGLYWSFINLKDGSVFNKYHASTEDEMFSYIYNMINATRVMEWFGKCNINISK